jgi:biopolymer transport protein TolR
MGMNVGGREGGPKADINITPLVDVVLVLLIIFMVVTPMMQKGPEVELPRAAHVTEETKSESSLIVTVDKAGLLYIDLDKTPLDRDTVSARVAEAHKIDPKRAVLVKGDKSLAYGEVRKVVDLLRKAGLEGVALAVEKPAGEGP